MIKYIFASFAFILLAACGQSGSSENVVSRQGEPDIIYFDHDDPAMIKAIATARDNIEHFWTAKSSGAFNEESFTIKVGLPTNDDSLEHIWVDGVSRDGATMTGVLANEPYDIAGGLTYGDSVSFTLDEVTDWSFLDGDAMRGHFATRIIVKGYPPEDAAGVLAMLHDSPLPTE